jgi:hypothetical protein
MESESARILELEIREQVAIENFSICRRIWRRLNRNQGQDIRIVLDALGHSWYRRHFGEWKEIADQKLDVIKETSEFWGTPATKSQAHRFDQHLEEYEPYFVKRYLTGKLKESTRKRSQRRSVLAKEVEGRKKKPKVAEEIVVKKETHPTTSASCTFSCVLPAQCGSTALVRRSPPRPWLRK